MAKKTAASLVGLIPFVLSVATKNRLSTSTTYPVLNNMEDTRIQELVDWLLDGDDETFKVPFYGNESGSNANDYDLLTGDVREIK